MAPTVPSGFHGVLEREDGRVRMYIGRELWVGTVVVRRAPLLYSAADVAVAWSKRIFVFALPRRRAVGSCRYTLCCRFLYSNNARTGNLARVVKLPISACWVHLVHRP